MEILPGKEEGRFKNTMGMVLVRGEYDEKKILSEVGTGWTDAVRDELWNNKDEYIGKLIEVRFQEVEVTEDAEAK